VTPGERERLAALVARVGAVNADEVACWLDAEADDVKPRTAAQLASALRTALADHLGPAPDYPGPGKR
jgi:hypothetical protein